jgi:hypothetical protein
MPKVLTFLVLMGMACAVHSQEDAKKSESPGQDYKAAVIAVQKQRQAECNWQASKRRLTGPKRQEFLADCVAEQSSTGSSRPGSAGGPKEPSDRR